MIKLFGTIIGTFLVCIAGVAFAQDTIAPNFTVGDSWKYRNRFGEYRFTVTEVLPGGKNVVSNTNFPGAAMHRDSNLTVETVEGDVPFDPRVVVGWKFIQFPVKPGDKFSYEVEGSQAKFFVDVKIKGVEEVRVPAGTFRALRIDSCWRNLTSGWYDCGMTHWYSPDTKAFIKRRTPSHWVRALVDTDYELVEFRIKPSDVK